MASNFVEKIHETLLKKLMKESGLECTRIQEESTESQITKEEIEDEELVIEQGLQEINEEIKEEEEVAKENLSENIEEGPDPFPSPSLRRIVPDNVRSIEQENRIHVLPDEFKKDLDPSMIPKINQTPHQKYIDILANMVGCSNYMSSLAEFWFLDTLSNLLRRAQDDKLDRATQALLILWFCEWMKEMQHFDAANRKRMLKWFEDNMISAAKFIATELHIPNPDEAGVYYKAFEGKHESTRPTFVSSTKPKEAVVKFEGTSFECAMRDLTYITHYIYDLFSTDYQFDLVRSVFCHTPDYILIDSPYQIQVPKKLFTPLKVKTEKTPKKEKLKEGKGNKKIPDTVEYIALMERKEKDDREFEKLIEKDQEEYTLRSHILPLNFAATPELFDKFWPPPQLETILEPETQTGKSLKSAKIKGKK